MAHCLAKPGTWQDERWEGDVVAKVGDKIFAFLTAPQESPTRDVTYSGSAGHDSD